MSTKIYIYFPTIKNTIKKIIFFIISFKQSSVAKRLDLLWKFLKPVSFSLIGKEINFAVLDGRVFAYGAMLVLLGSLVIIKKNKIKQTNQTYATYCCPYLCLVLVCLVLTFYLLF